MDRFWERYIQSRPAPGTSKGAFDAFAAAHKEPRITAQEPRIGLKHGGSWADWKTNYDDQMTFEEYLQMDLEGKKTHPIDEAAEGGRIGLQGGQLVQPGVGRQGFAGDEKIPYELQKIKNIPKGWSKTKPDTKIPTWRARINKEYVYGTKAELLKKIADHRKSGIRVSTNIDVSLIEDLVFQANQQNKYTTIEDIAEQYSKKKKLKKPIRLLAKLQPALSLLETPEEKVARVFEDLLVSDEAIDFKKTKERLAPWKAQLALETDLERGFINRILEKNKNYKNNKALFHRLAKTGYSRREGKNLPLKEQLKWAELSLQGRPALTGRTAYMVRDPHYKISQSAWRNWDQNKGNGDVQFFEKDLKNKWRKITWAHGGKDLPISEVAFSYKGGQKFTMADLKSVDGNITKGEKFFPEVIENQRAINELKIKPVDDPFRKGAQIPFGELMEKINIRVHGYSPKYPHTLDILHGPLGVKGEPFTNLSFGTSRLNRALYDLDQLPGAKPGLKNKLIKQAIGDLKGFKGKELANKIITGQQKLVKEFQEGRKFLTPRGDVAIDLLQRTPKSKRFKLATEMLKTSLGDDSALTKLIQNYLIDLCRKGSASGGRIGFKSGTPTVACGMDQLTKYLKNGVPKTEKTLVARILGMGNKLIKGAGQMLNPVEFFKLKNWVSAPALAAFGLFETGFVADDVLRKNKPLNEAAADNWLTGMMFNLDSQVEQAKNILGSNKHQLSPAAKEYAQSLIDVKRHDDLSARVGALDPEIKANVKSEMATIRHNVRHRGETGRFDYESALADKIDAASAGEYVGEPVKRDLMPGWWAKDADDEWRKVNEVGYAIKGASFDAPDKPGLPSFTSGFASAAKNIGKGKALILAQTKKQFVPGEYVQKKGQLPEPKVIDVPAYVSETFKPDLPTKENLNRLFQLYGVAHPRFGQVPEETLDLMIKQEKWRQLMERPEMKGSQERFAGGGLANLTTTVAPDSGPMQGLASTPEYATYRKEYKWQT